MGHVYSSSKIFHFHEKLDAMASGRITAPIHVRLKPTNRCTHRCCYCCYRNENLYVSEQMQEADSIPLEKMREIIADLDEMGVRAVTFTGGGEPLCYPHIIETTRGLLDAGIKVAMLTHGGLLKGEVADLLAHRAVWVRVSMDAADRDTYAATRGIAPGEFDRVCDNIRRFAGIEGRTCVLGVNLIVTKEDSDDVYDFLAMAKTLGVDHVKVSGVVTSTQPRENAEYLRPFFDSVRAQIARGQAELADASFGVIDKFHLPDSDSESFERSYTSCPVLQFLTVIAADQNVYACHDKAYTPRGLLGSIRDRRFKDLWFSEDLWKRMREINPSVDCRHHCADHGKILMLLDYFEADQEHLDFV